MITITRLYVPRGNFLVNNYYGNYYDILSFIENMCTAIFFLTKTCQDELRFLLETTKLLMTSSSY